MKIRLDQIEARLQSLIEGGAARLFSTGSPSPDLGTRLLAEMKAKLHPQTDGTVWAPNVYSLLVHPALAGSLENNRPLLDELAHVVWDAGEQAGLKFSAYPLVQVISDDRLKSNQMTVSAQYHQDDVIDTVVMKEEKSPAGDIQASAFLIVNGTETFPLVANIVNVGRAYDNHLVIEDPRISRYHAQLRAEKGRYLIFDLDSTGGTFVNGQRVRQAELLPGDVINLAGIPLIYGQDTGPSPTETQEFRPDNRW